MLAELLTLVIFTVILSKSATIVVENAVKLSGFFRISQLAMGILMVAISTSLPELSISILSSQANEGAIAAGNVFGSNIADMLLILGIGAFAFGFSISRQNLKEIALIMISTTVISIYIIYQSTLSNRALGFQEGILLLIMFAWYAHRIMSSKRKDSDPAGTRIGTQEGLKSFMFFFGGLVAVLISSSFVVSSAVGLAAAAGLSKSFIGATLIAVGTSLPELSVDLTALRKKQYGLALGDALGSTMVNLTLVLGTAAVINPIVVQLKVFIAALLFALLSNMMFLYLAAIKGKFGKPEGAAMVALYVLYLIIIFALQFS